MNEPIDLAMPTELNDAAVDAIPKAMLARALVDALWIANTPDDLVAITGLPRARCAEIVHLRQLLTQDWFAPKH
jgi:hypothetical protein